MITTIGTPSSQRTTLFIAASAIEQTLELFSRLAGSFEALSGWVNSMHELIYLVGLVVVVMFILSALGLH
jgi:hypothetical protein